MGTRPSCRPALPDGDGLLFGAHPRHEHKQSVLDVNTTLDAPCWRGFGTGHSSLDQLRDVPFDELKVDRGFVHGACRNASLRAIFEASLGMTRQLGRIGTLISAILRHSCHDRSISKG
jgi:predicted signal transduction protein with EAL and GGDEF domain